MKNILIISTRFPLPQIDGFAIKNYNLIRQLHSKYNLHVVIVDNKKPSDEDFSEISKYTESLKFFQITYFDKIKGLIMSIFKYLPLQVGLFYSSKAINYISNKSSNMDFMICSVIRSSQYADKFNGVVIHDLADSLSSIYKRDSNKLNFLKKYIYRIESKRLFKYEKKIIESNNNVFFFNKKEASKYKSSNVQVVPHGVDEKLFLNIEHNNDCSNGVVMFGRMNVETNFQAAKWFIANILDTLPEDIVFYIIGASPHSELLNIAKKNNRVKVLGYIDDPYPLIKGAIASVCPINMGGGIQNKIIESMAIGSINIVSPLAAIPFNIKDNPGLIIAKNIEEWSFYIKDILANKDKYEQNINYGKSYARKHFSWKSYGNCYKSIIEKTNMEILND